MSLDPTRITAEGLDLRNRFPFSIAVVGSPAAAAETIIAQVVLPEFEPVLSGVLLSGWAAFTVGTTGTACTLRLRRTNVAGTIVGNSGVLTGGIAAANLVAQDVEGVDQVAPAAGQIYVLTLQVTGGSAPSTVSAVMLKTIVV